MKPAFSTVACPTWTLDEVARRTAEWGYLGIELRTFGSGSSMLACDPALTSAARIRSDFGKAGAEPMCLATGIRYDDPISPPVIGRTFLFDQESSVRESKSAIDLAVALECPFVRIFGFEIIGQERRATAIARIAERLSKALDYARSSGVTLVIENGGSFSTAAELMEIIDELDHPLLAASYSLPIAQSAGENVANGVNVLGDRLVIAKVKDLKSGVPCLLGKGDLGAQASVRALAASGFKGWMVYEHDAAWLGSGGAANHTFIDAGAALAHAASCLYEWAGDRHISSYAGGQFQRR